jgi:hypothetical protein
MRLLIDECVDEHIRHLFPGHDCETARFANLAGLKNGCLLDSAESAGFEILITLDQGIPDQQNPRRPENFFDRTLRTNEPAARFRTADSRHAFRAALD